MFRYVFLGIFVAVMVGIGLYSKKKVKNINDFFLGGRQMGPWISAFAFGATYFSAVVLVGYAGSTGWSFGISATWIGIGNAVIGSLLAWLVLAKKTRRMTGELNASTMPEFFEKRFDSKPLKIVSAIIIFFFLIPYSASVYQGLSYLFSMAFNIPFIYCMVAMAFFTGVYLLLGGYIATALNDFIQAIIMFVGLILMVFFVVSHPAVGGLSAGVSRLGDIDANLIRPFSAAPVNLIGFIILTSLGVWGLPQMLHKFYAIKDENAIKRATIVSTIFAFVIAGGAYFIGSFGRIFLDNNVPVGTNGNPAYDMVVPQMLDIALPDALIGVIVILALSASMSTLSSLVLVSSSAISLDLVKGALYPKIDKNKNMLLMRILCALFIAVSFFVAATPNAIVSLMSFSWGTIAGSFLAPFLYGLYWKGTTKAGAWAGVISGFVCSMGLTIYYGMNTKLAPNIGSAAMLISLVVVPVVSFITAKYPEKHIERVFGGNAGAGGIGAEG